jgi:hypothetical protein
MQISIETSQILAGFSNPDDKFKFGWQTVYIKVCKIEFEFERCDDDDQKHTIIYSSGELTFQ